MPAYKLYYFHSRGKAEIARMIMAYGDIEYEDIRYSKEEWPEFKPKMPFGQMPVLEVDGTLIAQSGAIEQYLAKKAGLNGSDDLEAALIRMVGEACLDLTTPLINIFYAANADTKAALKKKYEEEQLPATLAGLERCLEKNSSSNHCVGDKMSLADIQVAVLITWPAYVDIQVDMSKYPKLKAVQDIVHNHPKIAAWIAKRPKTEM